jgi:CCR4-NOT transcription complex subunit 7/8
MSSLNLTKNTDCPKGIVNVFRDNFQSELQRMSSYIGKYQYVAMDTEFPGICYKLPTMCKEFYYRSIKLNVDNLKLIQVGFSLSNEKGECPDGISAWQFNLKFDIDRDNYSNESIALLSSSGINFEELEAKGIEHAVFAEYLTTSGLILNENIKWISFHGSYDFAYLLSLLSNLPLPQNESIFFQNLELYFPIFYDIKVMIQSMENFKGGLNKLASELCIKREGFSHQAGSDALLTKDAFFKLFSENCIGPECLNSDKNELFGFGESQVQAQGQGQEHLFSQFNSFIPPNHFSTNNNFMPPQNDKLNVLYSYIKQNSSQNCQLPNTEHTYMNNNRNNGYFKNENRKNLLETYSN